MAHQNQLSNLQVQNIEIEIIRKNIKNLYLRVYPQEQKVCLSCPKNISEATINQFILQKMNWIELKLKSNPSKIQLNSHSHTPGTICYVRGQPYQLQLIESTTRKVKPHITLEKGQLILYLPSKYSSQRIESILDTWYRHQLKAEVPELLTKWEKIVGVKVHEWRIKKMKTRWGTCNVTARRMWLNLALIKLPTHCLEYVIVHELVHLLERKHNHRFKAYLSEFMPGWLKYEQELQNFSLN